MFQRLCEKNRGWILISNLVLIGLIGVFLGGTIIILSLYALRGSTTYINKNRGLALNHACAEEALYRIKQNNAYTGCEIVNLQGLACNFCVESLSDHNRRVTISGTVVSVVTKTQILLNILPNMTMTLWKEVSDF